MKTLLIYSVCVLLIGCDPPLGKICIYNHTRKTIFVLRTCKNSIDEESSLRAYFPPNPNSYDADGNKMKDKVTPDYKINPNSHGFLAIGGSTNKPKLLCENKEVFLFFISEKTLINNTWEEICDKKLYEKKMKLNEHELDSMNWIVIYNDL